MRMRYLRAFMLCTATRCDATHCCCASSTDHAAGSTLPLKELTDGVVAAVAVAAAETTKTGEAAGEEADVPAPVALMKGAGGMGFTRGRGAASEEALETPGRRSMKVSLPPDPGEATRAGGVAGGAAASSATRVVWIRGEHRGAMVAGAEAAGESAVWMVLTEGGGARGGVLVGGATMTHGASSVRTWTNWLTWRR